MKRFTLSKAFISHYRPIIEYGGRPAWCRFEYAAAPLPQCGTIEINIAPNADAPTIQWFPDIQRGMSRGCQALHDQNCELVGIRVEIRKIHTHAIDTTAAGCERYGFYFILDSLRRECVEQEP